MLLKPVEVVVQFSSSSHLFFPLLLSPFRIDDEGSFVHKNPLPGEGEGAQNKFKLRHKKRVERVVLLF
jgi:hypothetical protein